MHDFIIYIIYWDQAHKVYLAAEISTLYLYYHLL